MAAPRPARPNVVIVMADQHRAGLTRRSGFPLDTMPALDRLAGRGVAFDRAYCPQGTGRQLVAILTQPNRQPVLKNVRVPTLIIHGERDSLVPLENAKEIYQHLGAKEKELLVIPSATHNDIVLVGFKDYFKALQQFIERTDRTREGR